MIRLRSLYHYLLAWLGSLIYRNPSKEIFVLGVTGTKGKSTVLELINAILEAAGKKTALISSVRLKVDNFNRPNLTGMTMPGRFFIQRFMREAVEKDCDYILIEVTSQGILQHRHKFIDFNSALFTNLEAEHIEAHGSFENYRKSKSSFFENVAHNSHKNPKLFFINKDAKDHDYFFQVIKGFGHYLPYSRKDVSKIKIKTKLLGEFNLENIAAAVAFARARNIDWDTIKNSIESFDGVPGRLEFIQKIPFSVIIDYAHTPDSLEKVYQTLKSKKSKAGSQRLLCVLGAAGGGRDMWKRPVMGEIAAKYCDQIILTNEDPFDEDPGEILNQIEAGIMGDGRKKVKKILDRKEAIRAAIKIAKKDDTVIITGKGSEPFMRVAGGKKISWNEREIVMKILNNERIEI
ncbi:MAG: UDP-N-acetylmuramyl-tripeptide synthetase [bacterium]|nr:UDP-N-acetylmuramyl-tripeptide synthetase [bacterium]